MRFEIQQEMDDEPVIIVDCDADQDSDDSMAVVIPASYGTPQWRGELARRIKAVLEEMAREQEESDAPSDS